MSGSRIFRLFACCVPVRGARRSTLCDLQRKTYRFIPNGLFEILDQHRGKSVDELKEIYEHRFDEEIDEYFAFLVEHEFGFWCDDPDAFPDLDLSWQLPAAITNAIIDVGVDSRHDFDSLFRQLDELGAKAVQLRFFRPVDQVELGSILEHTNNGRLRSIDLLMPYGERWTPVALQQLCSQFSRISNVVVHSSPLRKDQRFGDSVFASWQTQAVDSADHCGEVHPSYFVTDIGLFSEALTHNTCLNRKISVDQHGEIRNCPVMPRSFGNVSDTSLHSALLQSEFREYWDINKDQVEVCKDCEFRYLCTDCRAFIRDPDDRYSKPSKCNYDPHTAQWS